MGKPAGPHFTPRTLRLRLMPSPLLCCWENLGQCWEELRRVEGQFGASQSPGLPQAKLPLSRAPRVPLGRAVLPDVTLRGRLHFCPQRPSGKAHRLQSPELQRGARCLQMARVSPEQPRPLGARTRACFPQQEWPRLAAWERVVERLVAHL